MSPNNPESSQQSGFQMPRPGSKPGGGSGGSNGEEEENKGPEYLSDDDVVELDNEKQLLQVEEILERLDRELVGLVPIKTRIREIASLLLVDTLRRRFGLASTRPTLHMCFTGSPGTGKTTVAMRMAELLHGLGYLRKDHMVAVTRDDIVGQYVGHTAPKTKEVLKRAAGGVLFIDEAYYLYREDNERDYGQEAIEILLQVMENQRDDLVVILAGYKDKMDSFFRSNPGMASRIAHHMDFPDYSLDELMGITDLVLEEENYIFPKETQEAFREYMELRMEQPRFANARSVRNALDRARLRQANRLVDAGGKISKQDVMTIEAEDIRKSRVFSDSDPEAAEDGIDQVEDVGESEETAVA